MILTSLIKNLDYKALGSTDIEIKGIAYDSRKVKSGYLFICLKGSSVDSHKLPLPPPPPVLQPCLLNMM